jgi:3-deoxy-manno-octulosonate cytidylyltransferase (CMP-KDO synthetase)
MSTCAHPLHAADAFNPNVVKVVLDKAGRAPVLLARHHPVAPRCLCQGPERCRPAMCPLRHIGLYAYRNDFLQAYPTLDVPLESIEALEQLRVLWHGYPIAVHDR